jgi:threonine synthase
MPQFPEPQTFVTHLECSATGERHAADRLHNLSRAGKPLLVRYDLEGVQRALPRERLLERAPTLWRYRELLPVRRSTNIVSLGEVMTPIVEVPRIAKRIGAGALLVKQEGVLPTGSFKARGQTVAISMAKELGVKAAVIPTAGNAGAAMAAYCSRAGIPSYVFCPEDTPGPTVGQTALQGAKVYLVNGLLDECGKIAGAMAKANGWFDMSTLKEPYRIEGKKTMGLELAEQLGWELPDVIFYPTGGGTGFIGMWKAFDEMERIGWIGPKRPRMVCVQSSGCGPIVKAWHEGKDVSERWENASTFAGGLRAPVAIGDYLILRIIRESNGFGVLVSDDEIRAAWQEMGHAEGLLMCPEGAATFAAYKKALGDGRVSRTERAVLFDTASGLKYEMPPGGKRIDKDCPSSPSSTG